MTEPVGQSPEKLTPAQRELLDREPGQGPGLSPEDYTSQWPLRRAATVRPPGDEAGPRAALRRAAYGAWPGLNQGDFKRLAVAFDDQLAALAAKPDQEEPGLDVERLARARFALIDDIGTELSRELAQGNPFEPYDRLYVAKTITRVLDAARDRVSVAAGPVAEYARLANPDQQDTGS